MATVKDILAIARKELGTKESPASSNNVKYNTWFYGHAVRDTSAIKYPWCMAFVQWCFAQAGQTLPCKTASCSALLNFYRQNFPECVKAKPNAGDIVIYTFGHTGIVESVSSGEFTAIEGNTSIAGSQSNGGEVCRKTRKLYTAAAFIRPEYTKEGPKLDNKPSPAHEKGVQWAVQNGILNGNQQGDLMLSQPVTRQQLCSILYNYHRKFGKEGR